MTRALATIVEIVAKSSIKIIFTNFTAKVPNQLTGIEPVLLSIKITSAV